MNDTATGNERAGRMPNPHRRDGRSEGVTAWRSRRITRPSQRARGGNESRAASRTEVARLAKQARTFHTPDARRPDTGRGAADRGGHRTETRRADYCGRRDGRTEGVATVEEEVPAVLHHHHLSTLSTRLPNPTRACGDEAT